MALPKFAGCGVSPRPDHGIIILRKTVQNNRPNIEADVGSFKGLGEMMPAQLKETTIDPARRSILRVVLLDDDPAGTADSVERLMGTKAEARFAFVSDKAEFSSEDLLDV